MSVVEGHYDKLEREAAEKLSAALALPLPETRMYIGGEENFDPWDIFPAFYGAFIPFTHPNEFHRKLPFRSPRESFA